MKRTLTQTAIEAATPKTKAYEIRDTKASGFLIRVQPSGRKTYYCEYKRGGRVKIGRFQDLSTKQARDAAHTIIAKYRLGEDPAEKRKEERSSISYGEFLDQYYLPWVKANLRSAYEYKRVLQVNCGAFFAISIKDFEVRTIEKWRLRLLSEGRSPNTVNRIYTNFRASLSKAEEWGFIEEHPLRKMKPLKMAENTRVRYLHTEEEKRLRLALDEREERKRAERTSANAWRLERGYPVFPSADQLAFMDHLKPMILLSMNTGMRQGEVLKLTWSNVKFGTKHLTVTGQTAKSGKIRHLPLNSEAFEVLVKWRNQNADGNRYVFANRQGVPFDNVKKGWAKILRSANIEDFRWHDLRHHFASRLVMAGVNLNTVRELLGHSSYAMTLRYAHLSAGHKAEAVELLNSKL